MISMHNSRQLALVLLTGTATLAAQASREFVRDDVLGAMAWRALGPSTFGGRIVDIEVDPRRASTLYVASATGGLWKTENAGNTFRVLFDDRPSVFAIGDLAIAPSDPDVLYLGTGEANNQRSSYPGDGIYKSTDGGKSWQHVGLRGTQHIGRIAVHPTDPNRVYVAALGGLYGPNDDRGLYRTVDGGTTWQCVQRVNPDVGFVDVVIDPSNPDRLFATSYERRRRAWHFDESGPGSGIWNSVDAGATWQRLTGTGLPEGEIGRIGLSICTTAPGTVYAILENRNPAPKPEPEPEPAITSDDEDERTADPYSPVDPYYDAYQERLNEDADAQPGDDDKRPRRRIIGGEVWRSDDSGETWRRPHSVHDPVGGAPHYYYGQIRVAPTDPERVYVLGVRGWHSRDGGANWKTNYVARLHVDHHALWLDPRNPSHAWLGNDGGLAETWDDGASWRYVNGLPLGQFYAVGVDNREPYTVFGGTQDNGSWAIPSLSTTQLRVDHDDTVKIYGGDGFYVCVDPDDPDTVYAESQFGALGRLDLRDGSRTSIRPKTPKGSPPLRWNWMSPVAISEHASQTIYFGSQYLHRSRNRGNDWEVISPDLTTDDRDRLAGNVPHCTTTTIDESPHDARHLLVGTDDGKVWRTRSDGRHWTDLSDRFDGMPMPLWVSRVAFSPSDAETFYVSFTGYREGLQEPFLYLTTDGGESFRSITTGGLANASINVVCEHPRNPAVLFVGHDLGVSVSLDGGGTWDPLGQGLPTTPVHDLLVHPRDSDLVVGTHGRGIFILDIAPLESLDHGGLNRRFLAFQPRDGFRRDREFLPIRYPGATKWRTDRAPNLPSFRYYLRDDSDEAVRITVYDVTDQVLFEKEGKSDAGLHRIVWAATPGRRRGRGLTPAAGQYRLVVAHGDAESTFTFFVHPSPLEARSGNDSAEDEAELDRADDEHGDRDL